MGAGKVFLLFLRAIFAGLFNSGNKDWRIAGKELISKRTFRLPDSSYQDKLIGFRVLSRVFSKLNCEKEKNLYKHKILILDANYEVYNLRKEYIKLVKQYKDNEIAGVTKDRAFAYINGFSSGVYVFLLSFIVLPFTIFSTKRVQWALIFFEYIEISAVLFAMKKMSVQKIHFFSPAEKDANLAYLILNGTGVQVTKHPSPGALISHNRNLMTDTLAFSSNYQKDEYEIKLHETIKASATEFWPPEISFKYLDFYKEKKDRFKFKFGFYSHGGWIRVKSGKTNGLFAKPQEEEKCLKLISDFIKSFENEKIIIFLHPKEKADMKLTENYYAKWFSPEQVVFYTDKTPSSYAFYDAEFGIGSYSTILFERDYFGFKTILLSEPEREFPLKGTTFYKNSFSSVEELKDKINNYQN